MTTTQVQTSIPTTNEVERSSFEFTEIPISTEELVTTTTSTNQETYVLTEGSINTITSTNQEIVTLTEGSVHTTTTTQGTPMLTEGSLTTTTTTTINQTTPTNQETQQLVVPTTEVNVVETVVPAYDLPPNHQSRIMLPPLINLNLTQEQIERLHTSEPIVIKPHYLFSWSMGHSLSEVIFHNDPETLQKFKKSIRRTFLYRILFLLAIGLIIIVTVVTVLTHFPIYIFWTVILEAALIFSQLMAMRRYLFYINNPETHPSYPHTDIGIVERNNPENVDSLVLPPPTYNIAQLDPPAYDPYKQEDDTTINRMRNNSLGLTFTASSSQPNTNL